MNDYTTNYTAGDKTMNVIKVNLKELAKMISENADAQRTQCRIDCSPEDGRLYFAQQAEEQGDDFTIFDFYNCDMNLTYCDELIVWVKQTVKLPSGFSWK